MKPLKQWPVIRYFRFVYLSWKFETWWQREGRHLGAFPNPKDREYLEGVLRGKH
jgi:hypothetical protein